MRISALFYLQKEKLINFFGKQSLPTVVGLITKFYGESGDVRMQSKCFRCLQSWTVIGLSLRSLYQSPFWQYLLLAISSPQLIESVSYLMMEVFTVKEHPSPAGFDVAVVQIAQTVSALKPHFDQALANPDAPGSETFCIAVGNLGSSLGSDAAISVLARMPDTIPLVALLLDCVNHPNYTASEAALEFFSNLQTVPVMERVEILRKNVFEALMRNISRRSAALPRDFTTWDESTLDEDDFRSHRRKLKDAIMDSCTVLGIETLQLLSQILQEQMSEWHLAESAFFCVAAIAGELLCITDEASKRMVQEWIVGVVTQILGGQLAQLQHPLVRCTTMSLFEAYARVLGKVCFRFQFFLF